MTQPLPPYQEPQPSQRAPQPPGKRRLPRWAKAVAVGAAAVVLLGAGAGVGMAATSGNSAGTGMSMSGSNQGQGKHGTKANRTPGMRMGKHGKKGAGSGKAPKVDPAMQAWAHKYGVNRDTMPNLAPVAQASAAQQAAATALLKATETDTAKYRDLAVAKAAGYDLQASLTRAEKRMPGLARKIKMIDAGAMPKAGTMPMLHVADLAGARTDGKVLDPNAPETLMYSYTGHGDWKLIGVMYSAQESYPDAPPDPGGPITRWHYHPKDGGQHLMMHVFFVSDLAHAYAAEMS